MNLIMIEISLVYGFAGYIIFVTGLIQYIFKKAGKRHRTIGKIYFLT